jgi:four helix bundle protein
MQDAWATGMNRAELEQRSLVFARDVRKHCEGMRSAVAASHAVQQLLRASSSAAANYRAGGRARSRKEFVATLGMVNEEADEAVFWLEYLGDGPSKGGEHQRLLAESKELRAIFAAAYATARRNLG